MVGVSPPLCFDRPLWDFAVNGVVKNIFLLLSSGPCEDSQWAKFLLASFDNISIFAETPEGMQTLLDVVQEFTTWCGMEINAKKLFCS